MSSDAAEHTKPAPQLSEITRAARAEHLDVFGALHEGAGSIILFGPHEPGFWGAFTASAEYTDGAPDPMDRWSKRVIGALADRFGGTASFPSDGPPYPPFISWALASQRAWASPVGMLVHERAGLFVSYRGALHLAAQIELPPPASSPCLRCFAKPCQSACPVNALGPQGYDTQACTAHIAGPDSAGCAAKGCRSRHHCPVSRDYGRKPAQSAFHMAAFLQN